MTLQPNSNAGKIRAAIDQLGDDAEIEAIIQRVGPVKHFRYGWLVSLLPADYVRTVRNKYLRQKRLDPKPKYKKPQPEMPLETWEWV
jgi:hypothetical protein